MKKIILFLIAAAGALNVLAQNINPESDFVGHHNDYVKEKKHKEKKQRKKEEREAERRQEAPRHREHAAKPMKMKPAIRQDTMATGWCVELNAIGGLFTQNVTSGSLTSGYANIVNSKISTPQFNNGGEFGFDAEVGYFFGLKRHFGIGTGIMYIYEQSSATIDDFHMESQATDVFHNTYRQEITADHQIKETWQTSNFDIPLLLKYKTKFSNKVGFTADAGVLFNLSEKTAYKTNAAFDYEAVYQYAVGETGVTTTYDNGAVPAANDLLITKSQYLSTHSGANIQDYFNSLKAQGYNVGLGVTPNNKKGSVSYTSGSVGLLLRPAISIYLCDNFTLNLGVYYLYQNFSRNAASNYKITDNTGSYDPILNSVSGASNNSYGLTAGLRYCFSRACVGETMPPPAEEPVAQMDEDKAPPVSSENIQITTTETPAPPETEEAESDNHVDISTPLLFDVNKTVIRRSSYPILQEAIRQLRQNPDAYLVIHGYTDNTGTVSYNKGLSRRRAMAVKNYLRRHGIKTRTIKTIGHGESSPAASNHTSEGRARNRRAVIKLKDEE